SRRRHTRWPRDWSSDVCSSDLASDPGEGERTMARDRTDTERVQDDLGSNDIRAEGETHATIGGAAAAGAVTGGVIGLAGGPVGRSEERRVGKGGGWRG